MIAMLEEYAARLLAARQAMAAEWFAENKGAEIPDAEYRYPDCPICLEEVDGDPDSLWCDVCHVTWDLDGTSGAAEEPT